MALVCGVLLCVCYFPIGILGQVWYLIVSIPDLFTLTYFYNGRNAVTTLVLSILNGSSSFLQIRRTTIKA